MICERSQLFHFRSFSFFFIIDYHFVAMSSLCIRSLFDFFTWCFVDCLLLFFLWLVSTCVLKCLLLLMDGFPSFDFYLQHFFLLGLTYTGEEWKTLGKEYWNKMRCYGEHLWGTSWATFGNLRNNMSNLWELEEHHWEHDRNTRISYISGVVLLMRFCREP